MEQTGTLKKRRKRNLAKVPGQTGVSYNENDDSFSAMDDQNRTTSSNKNNHTTLYLNSSEFADLRKNSGGVLSSRTRPTRNPLFHQNSTDVFDSEDGQSEYSRPSTYHPEQGEKGPTRNQLFHQNSTDIFDNEDGQSEYSRPSTYHPEDNQKSDRPYFFDSHTMTRLKQIVFLGMTCGAFPWKWDKKETKIHKYSPKFQKLWQLFRAFFLFQSACLTVFQVYTFFLLASSGKFTNREIFMTSFSMHFHFQLLNFAINLIIYGEQIREYVNTLLKFNHDMTSKYVIHLDGHKEGGRILMNFGLLGDFSVVIVNIIYFLRMPTAPWYLFSYIAPKPWYWLIPGVIQTYWLAGHVIASHTLIYWMVTAHTNTMEFWLTEAHNNNDSDYTTNDLRRRETSIETFKSLQVLNNYFNDCVAPLFIPIIKMHSALITILCGFVMIRSMNYLFVQEFPQSMFYPIAVSNNSIDVFVMLTMSARVFDLSVSYIDSWGRTKDKDFRKILLSCPTLKIKVGRFYFITVSTTVKFFQAVTNFITNTIVSFE